MEIVSPIRRNAECFRHCNDVIIIVIFIIIVKLWLL